MGGESEHSAISRELACVLGGGQRLIYIHLKPGACHGNNLPTAGGSWQRRKRIWRIKASPSRAGRQGRLTFSGKK